MKRRGFLGSILALGVAPAIVRADSLMRIVPREALVLLDGVAPLLGLDGLVRVMRAHDLVTDSVILRLDTTNGTDQHCVNISLTAADALDWRKHIDPAREVLENHIKHYHGTFDGFRAPPPIADVHCEVL